jgi:ribonuclease P protein component
MDQRFRSASHIRRRSDFQQVYDRGARISGRLMTVFVLPRADAQTRLGIAATRKLGGAVVRNRAKRLVREIFRQHANPPGLDIVVVPRASLLAAPFPVIETDYATCVDRRVRRTRPTP